MMPWKGKTPCTVFLAAVATAAVATMSDAAGVLTGSRYEDDFDGGPLLTWPYSASDGITLGPDWTFQTPLLRLDPPGDFLARDSVVNVVFDYVPAMGAPTPSTLQVSIRTFGSGYFDGGYADYTFLQARPLTYGDPTRFYVATPFSALPRRGPTCTLCPRGPEYFYRMEAVVFDETTTAFNIDNFVLSVGAPEPEADLLLPEIAWPTNGAALPTGWTGTAEGGYWTAGPSGLTSRAIPSPASDAEYVKLELLSPPFRVTDLALATLTMPLDASGGDLFGNERVEIDLVRGASPRSNPAYVASLYDANISEIPSTTDNGFLRRSLLQDAFGGFVPGDYEPGATVYRIRTRVFDNDVFLTSFNYAEFGEVTLTGAKLYQWGDYNADGVIDAADYTVWRDTRGTNGERADGDGDGVVGAGDYNVWANAYRSASSLGTTSSANASPEPNASLLVSLAGTLWVLVRFR